MSESGDGLHLDGVHLLKRVIQDTGSVDDLPSEVLVVHVSDKERLGGEGVLRETNEGEEVSTKLFASRKDEKGRVGLTG